MKTKLLTICLLLFTLQVFAGVDWIQRDICNAKNNAATECSNVEKIIHRYNKYMKKYLEIGPIAGLVHLKKRSNRGKNQSRPAEHNGHYYLINDIGDIHNLITIWSLDSEITIK